MENTEFQNSQYKQGYWLETPINSVSNRVWYVSGIYRSIYLDSSCNASTLQVVRPVIEVPKSKISR